MVNPPCNVHNGVGFFVGTVAMCCKRIMRMALALLVVAAAVARPAAADSAVAGFGAATQGMTHVAGFFDV
jgi:hypothetical protein